MADILENSQEEADTKVFLCAQHVAEPVCIHTVDSDIGNCALFFDSQIPDKMYVSIGVKKNKRLLDIRSIALSLGRSSLTEFKYSSFQAQF